MIDFPTKRAFDCLSVGRVRDAIVVRLMGKNANVPTALQHYPAPCVCCHLPEQPVVCDYVKVHYGPGRRNLTELAGDDLAEFLILQLRADDEWDANA